MGNKGDVGGEGVQLQDLARRLLDLETRVLGLETKLSVVKKESSASSETVDTQPKVSIYGGNRIRK